MIFTLNMNNKENLIIFYKAITWRILATLITFLIAWAILGKVEYAAGIAWLDMLIKLVAYMGHEKLWLSISKNLKVN